jgi:Holliday junction DNA helicase RuvA
MIARIRGKLLSAQPECIIDVGGVGYEVMIPERDRESLSPTDQDVEFYTYLYVREDRMVLYGFLDKRDRELFTRLIDVTGVGPRLALNVLADYPATRVVAAIKGKDTGFLRTLPGLGKKTAERLSMELADKLDDIEAEPVVVGPPSEIRDDVIVALTSLGMTKHAAEAALEKIKWRPDDTRTLEEVVKEALKYAGNV